MNQIYDNDRKQEIINKLFSLHRFGIQPGLERTISLLDFAGNPQNKYPTVHVAGTNGKGSICSGIASILTEAGYKTGLYTSPHIIRFNERIRINGVEINDDDLVRLADFYLPEAGKINGTFFEITTAMAFSYFAENNVDIAIIETGMGGRFDSTNVLNPLLSVIAQVDYDHQEYLGNTIEEIAFEKAGIMKPGIPAVIYPNNEIVNEIIRKRAGEINAPLLFIDNKYSVKVIKWLPDITMLVDVNTPVNNYKDLKVQLAGDHQVNNLKAIIAAIEILQEQFEITEDSIRSGLSNINKNTGLIGRIQLIRQEPAVIIDVSHNPSAMEILFDTLKKCGYDNKWNIVFGAMADKDINQMLEITAPNCRKMFAAAPKIERALPVDKLKLMAEEKGMDTIDSGSVEEALKIALSENEPLLIAGSFYLLEEALPALKEL